MLVVDEEQVMLYIYPCILIVIFCILLNMCNLMLVFQRFGVKQKERIASLKTSVDVLTLSATPIPRTLYLALTGFRDARCCVICSIMLYILQD